jgi:hypothetical protein
MHSVIHKLNSQSTANTDRWPTPSIWGDCPVVEMAEQPNRIGTFFREDWTKIPILATPTITTQANYGNGWKAFGSSGGTAIEANIEGGGGLILTESDDNEGIAFQTIQQPFKISRSHGKLWFECRLKVNTVADTRFGFIVGLWEETTLTVTDPIAAAGTLADHNFVGFHRLEGDGDEIDTVYKANGITQVTVEADAIPSDTSLAADTYIKLGMVFDPRDRIMRWYFNGLQAATTKTIPSSEGDDFPNDVLLAPMVAMLCASGDDAIITWDWIQVAQLTA